MPPNVSVALESLNVGDGPELASGGGRGKPGYLALRAATSNGWRACAPAGTSPVAGEVTAPPHASCPPVTEAAVRSALGDAAGVDPLLGEGISFSLAYGEVAAEAIGAAFAQGRFDFADYPRRVRRHALLGQLPVRASLAQFRKRLSDPRLIGWLWQMTAATLRQTRWSDRAFVPADAEHPVLCA